MQLKFRSNLKYIFKLLVPCLVALNICLIGIIVALTFRLEPLVNLLIPLILIIVVDLLDIGIMIFVFKKSATCIFGDTEIIYSFKGNNQIIKLTDIKAMTCKLTKWYDYIVIMCYHVGGARLVDKPGLIIETQNNEKQNFGVFTKKEIKKLQAFYGELLQIEK